MDDEQKLIEGMADQMIHMKGGTAAFGFFERWARAHGWIDTPNSEWTRDLMKIVFRYQVRPLSSPHDLKQMIAIPKDASLFPDAELKKLFLKTVEVLARTHGLSQKALMTQVMIHGATRQSL